MPSSPLCYLELKGSGIQPPAGHRREVLHFRTEATKSDVFRSLSLSLQVFNIYAHFFIKLTDLPKHTGLGFTGVGPGSITLQVRRMRSADSPESTQRLVHQWIFYSLLATTVVKDDDAGINLREWDNKTPFGGRLFIAI